MGQSKFVWFTSLRRQYNQMIHESVAYVHTPSFCRSWFLLPTVLCNSLHLFAQCQRHASDVSEPQPIWFNFYRRPPLSGTLTEDCLLFPSSLSTWYVKCMLICGWSCVQIQGTRAHTTNIHTRTHTCPPHPAANSLCLPLSHFDAGLAGRWNLVRNHA